jgi:hypothetical protein
VKIEQLIVQHLYQQKEVTLQGIGSIFLNPSVALPGDNEKDFVMPENAFTYKFNLKATEDEALINYIVQQTRKIKPLATSDLESYCMLAKQFLNIGKPLVIDGVGTIQKNQIGDYEFIPGHFITPKIEESPKQLKEKLEEQVSFESETKKDNGQRNVLIVFITAIVALAGLGIYYYLSVKKVPEPEPVEQAQVVVDTVKTDTLIKAALDTVVVTAPVLPIKTDGNTFSIVLKDYSSEAAVNRAFAKLSEYGHKLKIIKVDSTRYQLVMPFKTPVSDTFRAKDSLRIFFGGKPYVLTQ